MSKRTVHSVMLMMALAGSTVAPAYAVPTVATTPTAAQIFGVAPPSAVAVVPGAVAMPLSTSQMSEVRGAGIFSFLKDVFKKVKKAIAGVIVSIVTNLFKSWVEQLFGVADGGQKEEKTLTVTENYNTQADFDLGNVASTTTEESAWTVTSSWSGSGCGGGGIGTGYNYDQAYMDGAASLC